MGTPDGMRLIRALAGTVLWVVAAVLGLVGAILCITIILLPVGLAVLGYSRRLFGLSVTLMAPRSTARANEAVDAAKQSARRRRRG